MADIDQFAEKVLGQFVEKITDEVFLSIEADKDLMREYLKLVDEKSLAFVNQTIGRKVKARFGLKNAEARQAEPKSKLILSHQTFE